MKELVPLIKDKKELRGIDDAFVAKVLREVLEEYPGIIDKYNESRDLKQFKRSMDYKILLKETRSMLREVYGMFIMEKYKKMEDALDDLEEDQSVANHCKILGMHRSSKERLPFYEQVYDKIFEITGMPESILDLACGLNPFSYPFLGCEPKYYAGDISPTMRDLINRYFEMRHIDGEAFVYDLLDFEEGELSEYEADVCFLFKTLDTVESQERDFSDKLLDLPAKWIVASFPRQSLGGGKTIYGEKPWFEDMMLERGMEFEFFQVQNESFYVVKTF